MTHSQFDTGILHQKQDNNANQKFNPSQFQTDQPSSKGSAHLQINH